ncbi:MAG: 50S ribosomal protein L10 [archaeon]
MVHKASQIPEAKKKAVSQMARLMKEYPIIGVVNMESLPAKQLQKMRATLRGRVELIMTKRRLIKLAIERVRAERKGIESLESHLGGMPALLFTKDNPFALAKILKANKSSGPIKEGQIAPIDIWVKEGATPFSPGPVIGELGAIGIKAGIEAGKVKIMKDSLVVEKGKVVSKKIADVLIRLGVEPVEIGLDLVAVYENGEIIEKEVLFVDEGEYIAKMALAQSESLILAIEIGYVNEETIKPMLGKSYYNAEAVQAAVDAAKVGDKGVVEAKESKTDV